MTNNTLRKEIKEKRNALSLNQIKKYSDAIFKNFFSLEDVSEKQNFFVYNAIKNEVDTAKIILVLKKKGKEISYPLTLGDKLIAVIPNSDDWVTGDFGVKVPKNYQATKKVDVAIIPLLACDKKMNRLGYGKGYYDKFLKENECIKVGICYDFQVVESLTPNAWDVPLDYIITPTKIIKKQK